MVENSVSSDDDYLQWATIRRRLHSHTIVDVDDELLAMEESRSLMG